jgi:hypothetical protein
MEQSDPVHALRHAQVQLPGSPVTTSAWLLQSAMTLHTAVSQFVPVKPGRHVEQSVDTSQLPGHVPQSPPDHELRHMHAQPVAELPVTDVACPVQLASTVHTK